MIVAPGSARPIAPDQPHDRHRGGGHGAMSSGEHSKPWRRSMTAQRSTLNERKNGTTSVVRVTLYCESSLVDRLYVWDSAMTSSPTKRRQVSYGSFAELLSDAEGAVARGA